MRKIVFIATLIMTVALTSAAFAMSGSQARSNASGFQHWACGSVAGHTCVNWNLIPPSCHGPTGGSIQWTCNGWTLEDQGGTIVFCEVESSWGPYGSLVHWWRASNNGACTGASDNGAPRGTAPATTYRNG